MILLGIETSTPIGSLALQEVKKDSVSSLFTKSWSRKTTRRAGSKGSSHSEVANLFIEEALNTTHLTLNDIDLFCTSIGPGSFTGIRVGINIIKCFAYALNKPIFALNSLELLSYPYLKNSQPTMALINAHKNQCYTAIYQKNSSNNNEIIKKILNPTSLTTAELEKKIQVPHLCVGDGYHLYQDQWPKELNKNVHFVPKSESPLASTFGQVVKDFDLKKQFIQWNQLVPLYIRASEAEEKLWKGILKPVSKIKL